MPQIQQPNKISTEKKIGIGTGVMALGVGSVDLRPKAS